MADGGTYERAVDGGIVGATKPNGAELIRDDKNLINHKDREGH